MSTITIGFSKSKHKFPLISWLIMLCEKTNFSHAYISFYSDSLDRQLIYEAHGSGVNFVGDKMFASIPVESFEIEISDEQKINCLKWCIDQLGKPYSRKELIAIGLNRFLSLLNIKYRVNLDEGRNSYICTELVACAMKELGFNIDTNNVGLKQLRDQVWTIKNQKNL